MSDARIREPTVEFASPRFKINELPGVAYLSVPRAALSSGAQFVSLESVFSVEERVSGKAH
jgi:hypothetical protein